MRKRGFSLVELLVVIAVIAVLMAILLPALALAKKRAKAVVCQSNMRQIGVCIWLYEQDNEQLFPRPSHSTADTSGWLNTMVPYGLNAKARACPEDPRFLNPNLNSTSYSTNDYMLPPEPYIKTMQVPRPMVTVFVVETSTGADHVHVTTDVDGFATPADFLSEGIAVQRHHGTANYLYVDGHVEPKSWVEIQKTFSPAVSFFDPATAR